MGVRRAGNFNDVRRTERNDWVVGHYNNAPRNARTSDVKWGTHDGNSLAGKSWAAYRTATIVS